MDGRLTCGNFLGFLVILYPSSFGLGFLARGLLLYVVLVLILQFQFSRLQFFWHVHGIFLCYCHVLCWFCFWCEVVLLGWSFRVLFAWLFSSCFVASAVQGGLLCMFVFGGAAAVFLPCLLLYCYVVWFFYKFVLLVLFSCIFLAVWWLSSFIFCLTNNLGALLWLKWPTWSLEEAA